MLQLIVRRCQTSLYIVNLPVLSLIVVPSTSQNNFFFLVQTPLLTRSCQEVNYGVYNKTLVLPQVMQDTSSQPVTTDLPF